MRHAKTVGLGLLINNQIEMILSKRLFAFTLFIRCFLGLDKSFALKIKIIFLIWVYLYSIA
jgi:hypothetical protein